MPVSLAQSRKAQVGGNVGVKADKSEKEALQIQDTFNRLVSNCAGTKEYSPGSGE